MATATVVAVVVIDQLVKYAVKTGFCLHEASEVTSWFYILFVENSGMAFGMSFIGTMFLTTMRIALVVLLALYMRHIITHGFARGYVACVSLVLAGALGNIIDNAFYGLVYTESTPFSTARLVTPGEGYGSFMAGKVVDMLYFPIIQTDLPSWLPFWGGEHFVFFSPVFNVADSAITCGAIAILIFYRRCLSAAKAVNTAGANGTDCDKGNTPTEK